MGTEPAPTRSGMPLLPWAIGAGVTLVVIAALPKTGIGGEMVAALSIGEMLLLMTLSLAWVFPRIQRAELGWVVTACLGVAAVSVAVIGSVFLVVVTCANTGGQR